MSNHCYLTYFDSNYLVKGLSLLESLYLHDPAALIQVVCLDSLTLIVLRKLRLPNVLAFPLESIEKEDKELKKARENRSKTEYYWTLTPTLILRFLENLKKEDICIYIDADIYFYSSPKPLLDEFGSYSVLIHRHNFPPQYAHLSENGEFNVGMMFFRHDDDSLAVLRWWRERCLEWCYARCEDDKMGDQKYLESFQNISDRVMVTRHPGAGVAPWNHIAYTIAEKDNIPTVDGLPVIFYHYHGSAWLAPGALTLNTDPFYRCTIPIQRLFAKPYLLALQRALTLARRVVPDFVSGFKPEALNPDACTIIESSQISTFRECYNAIVEIGDGYALCAGKQLLEFTEMSPSRLEWQGDYPDWESAVAAAGGYDSENIFIKVRDAARAVRDGKALWERDSVLFYEKEINWPLLAGLMQVAVSHEGKLHVLDFGGAFGSTFQQHRQELSTLAECTWSVVEQERLVECGQQEFSQDGLAFFRSQQEAFAERPINVILLSGVLQYIENPYNLLRIFVKRGIAIIIDRTPILPDREKITVQHVPPTIYTASYACRWLDKRRLEGILKQYGYTCSPWFQSAVDTQGFMGIIARREIFDV